MCTVVRGQQILNADIMMLAGLAQRMSPLFLVNLNLCLIQSPRRM